MITDADKAEMMGDVTSIIQDNQASITIRRGNSTLAPQNCRIARGGAASSGVVDQAGLEAVTTSIVILGPVTLNIQPADKFTLNGSLFQVLSVHPNRTVMTQAEAKRVS